MSIIVQGRDEMSGKGTLLREFLADYKDKNWFISMLEAINTALILRYAANPDVLKPIAQVKIEITDKMRKKCKVSFELKDEESKEQVEDDIKTIAAELWTVYINKNDYTVFVNAAYRKLYKKKFIIRILNEVHPWRKSRHIFLKCTVLLSLIIALGILLVSAYYRNPINNTIKAINAANDYIGSHTENQDYDEDKTTMYITNLRACLSKTDFLTARRMTYHRAVYEDAYSSLLALCATYDPIDSTELFMSAYKDATNDAMEARKTIPFSTDLTEMMYVLIRRAEYYYQDEIPAFEQYFHLDAENWAAKTQTYIAYFNSIIEILHMYFGYDPIDNVVRQVEDTDTGFILIWSDDFMQRISSFYNLRCKAEGMILDKSILRYLIKGDGIDSVANQIAEKAFFAENFDNGIFVQNELDLFKSAMRSVDNGMAYLDSQQEISDSDKKERARKLVGFLPKEFAIGVLYDELKDTYINYMNIMYFMQQFDKSELNNYFHILTKLHEQYDDEILFQVQFVRAIFWGDFLGQGASDEYRTAGYPDEFEGYHYENEVKKLENMYNDETLKNKGDGWDERRENECIKFFKEYEAYMSGKI